MGEHNRYNNLVIKAQRKIKEVTLDFGSQFASYYRRQIDNLCQRMFISLEHNDEHNLNKSAADLQSVLYELDREVRLQYADELVIDPKQLLTTRQKSTKKIARIKQIEKRDRYNNLIIKAQRRIKEVTLNYGDLFESYRRRIDLLCREILDSLEQDDQDALDAAEANLKDTLNRLEQAIKE